MKSPKDSYSSKVWLETGGDTGAGEVYTKPRDTPIAHIDWDEWAEGEINVDQVFYWLEVFGDIMPQRTRAELLTVLKPDDDNDNENVTLKGQTETHEAAPE